MRGKCTQCEQGIVDHRTRFLQAGDGRHGRGRAHVEIHALGEKALVSGAHDKRRPLPHTIAPVESRPFAHEGDSAAAGHPPRQSTTGSVDYSRHALHGRCKIHRDLANLNPKLTGATCEMCHARAFAQRLGRRAPRIHAGAAEQVSLEERDRLAFGGECGRERRPRLSAADHRRVDTNRAAIVVTRHGHGTTFTPFQNATRSATASAPLLGVG